MSAFVWFVIFVTVAASAEICYWRLRRINQDRIDMGHGTFELTFPTDMDLAHAARLFTSLGGLYKHPGKRGDPWGRPTIVFEVLGLPDGLHHTISFPKQLESSVRGHLLGVMPNMGMTEVPSRTARQWTYAMELQRSASNTVEADEKMVAVLLSSMREMNRNEAVMVQFVITATGNGLSGEEGHPFYVSGRLAASGHDIRARLLIERTLVAYRSLGVFSFRRLSSVRVNRVGNRTAPLARWPATLSAASLAVVCGLPIGSPQVPGLTLGAGRRLIASPIIPSTGLVIGMSTYPGNLRPLALDPLSAMQHEWVLGGTGSGKSTLLHNQATQIMEQGHGLILIEPKGDLARDVLSTVPRHRMADVIWFDPTDTARPIGLNVLAGTDPERTAGFITGLMKNLYGDSWGPRLEQILRYSVLTAAMNGLTLYDVKHLLVNLDYRAKIVRATKDHEVKLFWRRLDSGPDNQIDSVINKLDAFVGFSAIRNIVGQKDGLSIRDVVRQRKILLVSLPVASLGESSSAMLGSIVVAQIWQEIRMRQERQPVFLMMDEWQNFLNLAVSMESALAEARSYGLGMIMANQNTSQLSTSVLAAVRSNARTQILFGLGAEDAVKLHKDYAPLVASDLQLLAQYEVAARIMTPGGLAPIATAKTLPAPVATGHGPATWTASRALYGRPVAEVEAEFIERFKGRDETRKRPAIGRETAS